MVLGIFRQSLGQDRVEIPLDLVQETEEIGLLCRRQEIRGRCGKRADVERRHISVERRHWRGLGEVESQWRRCNVVGKGSHGGTEGEIKVGERRRRGQRRSLWMIGIVDRCHGWDVVLSKAEANSVGGLK